MGVILVNNEFVVVDDDVNKCDKSFGDNFCEFTLPDCDLLLDDDEGLISRLLRVLLSRLVYISS